MPAPTSESPTLTLLRLAAEGDRQAAADLLPVLYAELRTLAASWMARQPGSHTLQATALVHEAYARLVSSGDPGWEGRRHFFFAAARAMQDILVDHARRKASLKRGGGHRRVEIPELASNVVVEPEEMLALDRALQALHSSNERMHSVVMLRYFAGLTVQETALALGVDPTTVSRDWRVARAWLFGQLEREADGAGVDGADEHA